MRVRTAGAAHSAGAWVARTVARRCSLTSHAGSESGKALFQFGRTAMRAFGSLPIAGTDEHFAFLVTRVAVKFVERHKGEISGRAEEFPAELKSLGL